MVSVRHGIGGVAVHHQEIFVPAALPDNLQKPHYAVKIPGVWVDEDRTVAVLFRNLQIAARHVLKLQLLFLGAHLPPLVIGSVQRVNLSDGLHGKVKYQLKMRHMPCDGLMAQGADKPFSFCHIKHPLPFEAQDFLLAFSVLKAHGAALFYACSAPMAKGETQACRPSLSTR